MVHAPRDEAAHLLISEDKVVRLFNGDVELLARALHEFEKVAVLNVHCRILSHSDDSWASLRFLPCAVKKAPGGTRPIADVHRTNNSPIMPKEIVPHLGVISRTNMFEPLLEAEPSFIPIWKAFLEEWQSEPEPPLYLALSSLARHLIARLRAGETDGFHAVFEVVERWHLQGDAYVREAASVGLLEDLQNTDLHQNTVPTNFEPWLRPESWRWWGKLDRFWSLEEPPPDA